MELPPAAPLPLIEALLIADSAAVVRITWLEPGRDGADRSPVSPELVALTLHEAGGGSAGVEPVPGAAGVFQADMRVRAGGRYRLEGTIDGRTIAAVTRLPDRFQLLEPADDTLLVPGDRLVPFRWRAAGVAAMFAIGARASPAFLAGTRDTVGLLAIDAPDGELAASPLLVVGANADAERYLLDPLGAVTNVRGGFGFVGGGIVVTRVLRWP